MTDPLRMIPFEIDADIVYFSNRNLQMPVQQWILNADVLETGKDWGNTGTTRARHIFDVDVRYVPPTTTTTTAANMTLLPVSSTDNLFQVTRYASSARKYKKDIVAIPSVPDLSLVDSVSFKYIQAPVEGNITNLGFIADDFDTAFPTLKEGLVSYDNGTVENIKLVGIVALLWKACQDLQARVAVLETP